jgi:hypothetical protein
VTGASGADGLGEGHGDGRAVDGVEEFGVLVAAGGQRHPDALADLLGRVVLLRDGYSSVCGGFGLGEGTFTAGR